MNAFSPRIRHALNFALKHHAGQTRKNRNAPYIMHPMQVALILAVYDRPEAELVGAILHDVVEDCVKTDEEAESMRARIRDKFGADVLAIVDGVTEPKRDEKGEKLPAPRKRAAYLKGLETAPVGSLWVCAADKIQNGNELLIDLADAQNPDVIWARFAEGKERTAAWYRSVHTKLRDLRFDATIMGELDQTAARLEDTVQR
jgi:(p)ppGpp synthase/HD superfamily hydrolase